MFSGKAVSSNHHISHACKQKQQIPPGFTVFYVVVRHNAAFCCLFALLHPRNFVLHGEYNWKNIYAIVINMSRAVRTQIRANMLWKVDEKCRRPTSGVSLAFLTHHAYLPLGTQLFPTVLSSTVTIFVQEVLDGLSTCLSF